MQQCYNLQIVQEDEKKMEGMLQYFIDHSTRKSF